MRESVWLSGNIDAWVRTGGKSEAELVTTNAQIVDYDIDTRF